MVNNTPLTAVPGIGAATAARLTEHGVKTAEQLAAISIENLAQVPGFSVSGARSATIHAAAVELVGAQPDVVEEDKKGKKNKKRKKAKKKAKKGKAKEKKKDKKKGKKKKA